MSAKVSIIVPVYNTGKFLRGSVACLLEQSYTNTEILLIDDGSIDDSLHIAKELAKEDSRIKVFNKKNGGAGSARNMGIENASGDYYYFPDSDDDIRRDAVEKLVSAIENTGADMAVCGYSWVDRQGKTLETKTYEPKTFDGEYIRAHFDEFLPRANPYGIYGALWNKLFRADMVKKHSLRIPELRKSQDEVFNYLYISKAGSICFIADVLYFYRIGSVVLKGKKYLENYCKTVIDFKNCQMEIVYNWNRGNTAVLELISRNLAVNLDAYIQMRFAGEHIFAVGKKVKIAKETSELLRKELPLEEPKADFRKYKYMLGGNYIKLYLLEEIKLMIVRIKERNLL